MVRLYMPSFLVVLSLYGIYQIRADEVLVEAIALTSEPAGMKPLDRKSVV